MKAVERFYADRRPPGSGNSERWLIFDRHTGGRDGDQIATVYDPTFVETIVAALNKKG